MGRTTGTILLSKQRLGSGCFFNVFLPVRLDTGKNDKIESPIKTTKKTLKKQPEPNLCLESRTIHLQGVNRPTHCQTPTGYPWTSPGQLTVACRTSSDKGLKNTTIARKPPECPPEPPGTSNGTREEKMICDYVSRCLPGFRARPGPTSVRHRADPLYNVT